MMRRPLPPPDRLLSREDFARLAFARDGGRCLICGAPAKDAHHLIERKLFPDGGYYLGNAASLCAEHHLEAEMTVIPVETLRRLAGIGVAILPPGFDPAKTYDKWGNEILDDGRRRKGPLFEEDGVRKILARAGLLGLFADEEPAMDDDPFYPYPRTPHLATSRLQKGDGTAVPFETALAGKWIVVEEKADGSQLGFDFDGGGDWRLQNRGDRLHGGAKERQYSLAKRWIDAHAPRFLDRFSDRYLVFAEWMAVRHSMFYDALPHLALQYDIIDKEKSRRLRRPFFLSTAAQRELLADLPIVRVPVLYEGPAVSLEHLWSLVVRRAPHLERDPALKAKARALPVRIDAASLEEVGPSSRLRTKRWRKAFLDAARKAGCADPAALVARSDASEWMEGLYIKVEDGDETIGRYKLVRPDFVQTILDSGVHWSQHAFVMNKLADGVDIFAP